MCKAMGLNPSTKKKKKKKKKKKSQTREVLYKGCWESKEKEPTLGIWKGFPEMMPGAKGASW
jgi:hypothetical protein